MGHRLQCVTCAVSGLTSSIAVDGNADYVTRMPGGGVLLEPPEGTAVVWDNIDPSGDRLDKRAEHSGTSIKKGEKWGINVWLPSEFSMLSSSARLVVASDDTTRKHLKKCLSPYVDDALFVETIDEDSNASDDAKDSTYAAHPKDLLRQIGDGLPPLVRDGKVGKLQLLLHRRDILRPNATRARRCWLEIRGSLPASLRNDVLKGLKTNTSKLKLNVRAESSLMAWT